MNVKVKIRRNLVKGRRVFILVVLFVCALRASIATCLRERAAVAVALEAATASAAAAAVKAGAAVAAAVEAGAGEMVAARAEVARAEGTVVAAKVGVG